MFHGRLRGESFKYISKKFKGCLKVVCRILREFEGCIKVALRVLQERLKSVFSNFQGSFKSKKNFNGNSRKIEGCYMKLSKWFQECFRVVSKKIEEFFNREVP